MTEDRIIKVDYEEEMRKSYIDYAMSVIVQRAIPDVRDGLKPVHRRILYAMQELNLQPDKPYRKSARIVGDTMGKYHPHGDSSIYLAMVRMSQDYSLLLPLVQGHGNFGSIDGDSAAAMRYTEARLASPALEILKDMDKEIVDFRDNFDGSLKEPEVLPSRFPNLLVNGATGIAVGMKTDIPPHNLGEVINACKAYIDNENISIAQLRKYIKGADFPTGGIIVNKDELSQIYETGTGKIKVRSKIEIEPAGAGRTNLVITEIPYSFSGSKIKLLENIVDLMKDKKLEELSDFRDESGKEGIRIVLEAKKGVNIDNLLVKLFQKTKLEDTIAVNFLAIVDNKPKQLNLKDIIKHFIDFQKEINLKKYKFLLNKINDRKEIVEGLIKAQDIIDLIIEILRGSKDVKTAKDCLINGNSSEISFKSKKSEKMASTLNFTERQAVAILDMKLQKLIGLELQKLLEEEQLLIKNAQLYKSILENENQLCQVIKEELEEIKKLYSKKRRTEIIEIGNEIYIEPEETNEEIVILIDKFGYTKTIDMNSYSRLNPDTLLEYTTIRAFSKDKLLFFTKDASLYQLKISSIPHGKIKDKGVLIDSIFDIKRDSVCLLSPFEDIKNKDLLFLTKRGNVKIVPSIEFESNRKNIASTKLDEDDEVILITPLNIEDTPEIAIISDLNRVSRFKTAEIPIQKKTAKGVTGFKLKKQESIVNAILINDNTEFIKINNNDLAIKDIKISKRCGKITQIK